MPASRASSVDAPSARKPGTDTLFLLLLVAGTLFAAGFLFFTRNTFSYNIHADEPGKVLQIQLHQRNFHHPQLMLNTVQLAVAVFHVEPTSQNVVHVGRVCSAVFTTLAILALTFGAFLVAGRLAAVLCAVFLLISPLFIELAHYFKEDPSLMMGIACAVLGMILYQRNPKVWPLLFLAVSAGLACSGKHVGILILPFCFFVIAKNGASSARRHLLLFVGALLLTYALVNYQVLMHLLDFKSALKGEVGNLPTGRKEVAPQRFSSLHKYFGILGNNLIHLHLWLTAFCLYSWWKRRERIPLGSVFVFAALLFFCLSMTPQVAMRYLMPVVGLLAFTSAIGAARILAEHGWVWKIAAFTIPLTCGLVAEGRNGINLWKSFEHDSRMHAAQWIAANLPKDALIAQDYKGMLTTSGTAGYELYQVPQPILPTEALAGMTTLEEVRAKGVRYFIAFSEAFRTAALKRRKLADGNDVDDSMLRELKANGHVLWRYGGKNPRAITVNPTIEIYQLDGK